jgi:hypothetical protein
VVWCGVEGREERVRDEGRELKWCGWVGGERKRDVERWGEERWYDEIGWLRRECGWERIGEERGGMEGRAAEERSHYRVEIEKVRVRQSGVGLREIEVWGREERRGEVEDRLTDWLTDSSSDITSN